MKILLLLKILKNLNGRNFREISEKLEKILGIKLKRDIFQTIYPLLDSVGKKILCAENFQCFSILYKYYSEKEIFETTLKRGMIYPIFLCLLSVILALVMKLFFNSGKEIFMAIFLYFLFTILSFFYIFKIFQKDFSKSLKFYFTFLFFKKKISINEWIFLLEISQDISFQNLDDLCKKTIDYHFISINIMEDDYEKMFIENKIKMNSNIDLILKINMFVLGLIIVFSTLITFYEIFKLI